MKTLLYIMIIALGFTSCTERIDIELDPSEVRIVVEGHITNDAQKHLVKISKSSDYLSGVNALLVSGASVYVKWDQDSVRLKEDSAGYYYTPETFFAKERTMYELQIANVDIDGDGELEVYRAKDSMTYDLEIDSIALGTVDRGFGDNEFVRIMLYAQEPEEENYYIFKTRKNGVYIEEDFTDWNVSDDVFFNGNYTNGADVKWINQSDTLIAIENGDFITLELIQISSSFYQFLNDALLESFGSIPLFSGPPANIVGNISNGGMGYFSLEAVSRSTTVFKRKTAEEE